jgi:hypothetical protein
MAHLLCCCFGSGHDKPHVHHSHDNVEDVCQLSRDEVRQALLASSCVVPTHQQRSLYQAITYPHPPQHHHAA